MKKHIAVLSWFLFWEVVAAGAFGCIGGFFNSSVVHPPGTFLAGFVGGALGGVVVVPIIAAFNH